MRQRIRLLDGDNLKQDKRMGEQAHVGGERKYVQDNTPFFRTNHLVAYPFATFVYLLIYPRKAGGSFRLVVLGDSRSVVSWFVT